MYSLQDAVHTGNISTVKEIGFRIVRSMKRKRTLLKRGQHLWYSSKLKCYIWKPRDKTTLDLI